MSIHDVERAVADALHASDGAPVGLAAGREGLADRIQRRHNRRTRSAVLAAAAAVLLAVIAVPVVLDAGKRGAEGPASRRGSDGVLLSPSGLPVGLLQIAVPRELASGMGIIRLRVREDGTGTLNTVPGGLTDGGPSGFQVRLVTMGEGIAGIRYDSPVCADPTVLRLAFSRRGTAVDILDATTNGCVVSKALARAMVGGVLQLRPDRIGLSPSGLPVGVLEGGIRHGSTTTRLQLLVRGDGTGQLAFIDLPYGHGVRGIPEPFDVRLTRGAAGAAVVSYPDPTCGGHNVMSLQFAVVGFTVVISHASAGGCVLDGALVDALPGTAFTLGWLPADGELPGTNGSIGGGG